MLERNRWYTVEQVAQALGVHPETIRRKIRQGRLPAEKALIGQRYRIKGADVLDRITDLEQES